MLPKKLYCPYGQKSTEVNEKKNYPQNKSLHYGYNQPKIHVYCFNKDTELFYFMRIFEYLHGEVVTRAGEGPAVGGQAVLVLATPHQHGQSRSNSGPLNFSPSCSLTTSFSQGSVSRLCFFPDMSYSRNLQDHVHHPGRMPLPPSLGNYMTSYTNQYIRSAQVLDNYWVVDIVFKVRNTRETCRISSGGPRHHIIQILSGKKWTERPRQLSW